MTDEDNALIAALPQKVRLALSFIAGWECLKGYPRTIKGIVTLARAFAAMCPEDKYEWLSNRVACGVNWCPTPLELRRICTHGTRESPGIRPLDGRDADEIDMEEIAKGEGR